MTARTLLPFVHAADEAEPGAWYHVFSASQIETFLDCRRKWAWDKIARIPRPTNGSAALGDRVHAQLEGYLDGGSFDFTEVVSGRKVAEIAASSIHLLPEPCAPGPEGETEAEQVARHARHGMAIEGEFRWQSESTKFVYTGRKDLQLVDSGAIPGLAEENGLEVDELGRTGVPAVLDHKSTSSFQYVKEKDVLEWDVQANLYAYDLIATTGAEQADLVWNYMKTRGANDARRVHLRVHRDQAKQRFALIQDVAKDMATIRDRAPKFSNAPRDGLEGPPDMGQEWRETLAAFVEGISPNANACEKFGGCSYRHVCRLGPAEGQFRFMTNEKSEDLFDSLRKRASAQDVAAGVAPELPPTCAPEAVPAPEAPPAWTTAPVDPMSLKKVRAPASSPAPVEINPPESKLPPPVPPPPPAAPAPRVKTEEEIAAEGPKTTNGKRRGRPPGSKNAPKDPTGADALAHTEPTTVAAPTAAWAAPSEIVLVAKCAAATPPETPPNVLASGEACTAQGDALEPCEENAALAYELFVNCFPIGREYALLEKYVARAQKMIQDELAGTDAAVSDYRFIPYGKANGALSVAVVEALRADPPAALMVRASTDEGRAVLASLMAHASSVVMGVN